MPTTDHTSIWTALEEISEMITSSNESADLRGLLWGRDEWPNWYHQLLNQIHSLAAGSPIEYITSSIGDSRIEGNDLYAFTANLAIHTQVSDLTDGARHQNATVRSKAWPRTTLAELTVVNLQPYPVQDHGIEVAFPRNLSLELNYGSRGALRLPLTRFANGDSLDRLYPSLLADLSREAN